MPAISVLRLSMRAALASGMLVTLGLWLYTGYSFNRRLDDVERQAAQVAARHLRAQELLATVRTQVLVASVRVRDALLNPDPTTLPVYREQVMADYQRLDAALSAYEPVLDSEREHTAMRGLRREVEEFRDTAMTVLLVGSGQPNDAIRALLNSRIVPRRTAAVQISDEVQALNRAAFLQQQADLTAIHRGAQRQTLQRLGATVAISAAVLLFAGVYATRLEHRLRSQLEREARLSDQLQEAHSRLMQAQEEERRVIARELHDEVGQVLTAIKFELGLAGRAMDAQGMSPAPLAEAQRITAGAIRTVREVTQLLHPADLDDLGLVSAVEALLRGLARRHDLRVSLTSDGVDRGLGRTDELAAYRIVQEALTNVAKHAHASTCRVDLRRQGDLLTIDVVDDGVGFDVERAAAPADGLGLIGIRERASHLGGISAVTSQPGGGTRIHAELPLTPAAAAVGADA